MCRAPYWTMGKQRRVRDIPIFRLLGPQLHRQGPAQGWWLGTPAGRRRASQREEGTSSRPGEEWVGRKWAAWGAGCSQPPRLMSMMPRWSAAYSNARHLTASVWDAHSREDSGFIVIFSPRSGIIPPGAHGHLRCLLLPLAPSVA